MSYIRKRRKVENGVEIVLMEKVQTPSSVSTPSSIVQQGLSEEQVSSMLDERVETLKTEIASSLTGSTGTTILPQQQLLSTIPESVVQEISTSDLLAALPENPIDGNIIVYDAISNNLIWDQNPSVAIENLNRDIRQYVDSSFPQRGSDFSFGDITIEPDYDDAGAYSHSIIFERNGIPIGENGIIKYGASSPLFIPKFLFNRDIDVDGTIYAESIYSGDVDLITLIEAGGGGITTLAGLSDTNITSPVLGDVLVYNNTESKWKNVSPIDAIETQITGTTHDEITATTLSAGTIYSGSVDLITLIEAGGGGITEFSGLSDTNITSPTIDNTLKWDGSDWINTDDLDLVSLSAVTIYSGSNNLTSIFSDIDHNHEFSEILNTGHTHEFSVITNTGHTHSSSDIVDLTDTIETQITGITHDEISATTLSADTIYSGVNNLTSIFSDIDHNHEFSEILNTGHTHVAANITDFTDSVETQITGTNHDVISATTITATTYQGIDSSMVANTGHTHEFNEILNTGHTHEFSEIENTGHTHEFSEILNTGHTHLSSDIVDLTDTIETQITGTTHDEISATSLSAGTIYSGNVDVIDVIETQITGTTHDEITTDTMYVNGNAFINYDAETAVDSILYFSGTEQDIRLNSAGTFRLSTTTVVLGNFHATNNLISYGNLYLDYDDTGSSTISFTGNTVSGDVPKISYNTDNPDEFYLSRDINVDGDIRAYNSVYVNYNGGGDSIIYFHDGHTSEGEYLRFIEGFGFDISESLQAAGSVYANGNLFTDGNAHINHDQTEADSIVYFSGTEQDIRLQSNDTFRVSTTTTIDGNVFSTNHLVAYGNLFLDYNGDDGSSAISFTGTTQSGDVPKISYANTPNEFSLTRGINVDGDISGTSTMTIDGNITGQSNAYLYGDLYLDSDSNDTISHIQFSGSDDSVAYPRIFYSGGNDHLYHNRDTVITEGLKVGYSYESSVEAGYKLDVNGTARTDTVVLKEPTESGTDQFKISFNSTSKSLDFIYIG
jgi:hypothetical protein